MKKGLAVLESKERARFGTLKGEEKKRSEEQKKRKEQKRARVCGNRGSFFPPWVFYPLVISEVVYCSHDLVIFSEMKYLFP